MTADGLASLFRRFVNEPEKQLFWHSLFMVSAIMVVARGLKSGVEPLVRYAMPTVFLLLLALLLYAAVIGEFNQAVYRLLYPDFTKLTRAGMLAALGHAFFSLSLGTGVLLAYAAYLQKEPVYLGRRWRWLASTPWQWPDLSLCPCCSLV